MGSPLAKVLYRLEHRDEVDTRHTPAFVGDDPIVVVECLPGEDEPPTGDVFEFDVEVMR